MKRVVGIVLGLLIVFQFSSCSFLAFELLSDGVETHSEESEQQADDENAQGNNSSEIPYSVIKIDKPSFLLGWDTSGQNVQFYRIYYKLLNSQAVQELSEVNIEEESEISVELTADIFEKDEYIVLGVAAVDTEGNVSEIHFSTDSTAVPSQGWVLMVL